MKWKCYSYNNPYSPQEARKESVNEQISLPYPISLENKDNCGIQLEGEFMEYYYLSEFLSKRLPGLTFQVYIREALKNQDS